MRNLFVSAKRRGIAPVLFFLIAGQFSARAIAAVTVAPSQLQFAAAQVGSSSAPQTVTITNTGAAAVSDLSISVAGDFWERTTCRASLKAGASCQVSVTFSPAAAGLRSGNLTVAYKGQGSSTVLSLSGQAYALVSIAISPQTASIPAGAARQFYATGSFTDGSIQDISSSVTWSSSNASTLTVTSGGVVTGVAAGSAQVTASWTTVAASVSVNVTTATLVSLAVDTIQLSLPQGYTQQFNAVGSFSDGTQLVLTNQVAWTSSAPAVAAVSTTGLTSTLSPGTASITAQFGSVSSSATLTVTGVTLQSIAISPSTISMASRTILQVQATGTYSDGSTRGLTNQAAWTSSATNIATIAVGRINSANAGAATISASFAGLSASAGITVSNAQLESIAVGPGTRSVPAGVSPRFTATGTFSDGSTEDVSLLVRWTSSSAAVATVANSLLSKGVANTLASGTAAITASYTPSVSGTSTLTVDTAALVSIAVTPSNRTIPAGGALQFTAMGTFSDLTTQNITQSVTWLSGNPGTLLVDNDPGLQGFGYGLAEGQTVVSATVGTVNGATSFAVAAPALISIGVSPQNATLVAGNTQQLTATGTFGDGSTQDLTASATWSSSSNAATVGDSPGSEGLALGIAAGQATITAASGGVSGSAPLTVTPAQLVSISVTPANPTAAAGATQQFAATGAYTDGSTQNLTATATWSATPATIASVGNGAGSQGLAQALAAGQATIAAASGSVGGSAILTVNPPPAQLTSISVSPSVAVIFAGSTQQFTATGTYSDGSTQDLTGTATWSDDPSSVASVSNTPGSQGLAQALTTGAATITATDGTISATAQLSVVPLLTGITVSPSSANISVGGTQQFTATGTYSDGSTEDLTATSTWTTNPATAATIGNAPGNAGLAQALASGSATISAAFATINGTASLTIAPVLVSISVTPADPAILSGSTQQFAATGTYSDSSTQNLTNQVAWSAVPGSIATISTGGLAQALIGGQATITAALGPISNYTALTVSAPPPVLVSLAISPPISTLLTGSSVQFDAVGTFSDGSTQNLTSSASWTSLNPTVAAIGTSGLATGIAIGTTTIGASVGAIGANTASLTIMGAPPLPGLCQPATSGLPPLPASAVLPAPPQSCTVPVYPAPSGAPILVTTAEGLQGALIGAQCGQWIQVQAGVTFQGAFVIPGLACPASNPVLVENSDIRAMVTCTATSSYPCSASTVGQTLPVFPQWTAPSQSLAGTSYVPTLESTNSSASLFISDGVANWYIAGIEVTLAPSAKWVYPIVGMGEDTSTIAALPQNITFDRVLVHPAPCLADSLTAPCNYVSRGIDLNAVNGTVMYSNIWAIVSTGQDTQAVLVNNSTGPGLVLGNYLEATGENLIFNTECTFPTTTGNAPNGAPWGSQGFTTGDIGIPSCPAPSDYTVRLNHFHKSLAWQTLPAGCNAAQFQCYDVKNHFEVKHGQRILVDSNVFDTTYSSGQAEFFISNCFAAGIYVCQDLTLTSNLIEHGPNIGSVSGNGWPVSGGTAITTGTRTLVRNNVSLDINGIAYGGPLCSQTPPYTQCAGGTTFHLQQTFDYTIDHNTSINQPSQYQNALIFTDYPPSTDFGFELTNNLQFGSPFANANTPGGTIAGLPSPTLGGDYFVGDYWSYPTIWGVTNTPVYPPGVQSLSSGAVSVPGNPPVTCQNNNNVMQTCWALDWALVGFVDFTDGNAGTDLSGLALASTSLYHNAGTDGADIGANVAAVAAAISPIQW